VTKAGEPSRSAVSTVLEKSGGIFCVFHPGFELAVVFSLHAVDALL